VALINVSGGGALIKALRVGSRCWCSGEREALAQSAGDAAEAAVVFLGQARVVDVGVGDAARGDCGVPSAEQSADVIEQGLWHRDLAVSLLGCPGYVDKLTRDH
jgi:hypothetical protein